MKFARIGEFFTFLEKLSKDCPKIKDLELLIDYRPIEATVMSQETEEDAFNFGVSGDFNADTIPPPDSSRTKLTPSMYD